MAKKVTIVPRPPSAATKEAATLAVPADRADLAEAGADPSGKRGPTTDFDKLQSEPQLAPPAPNEPPLPTGWVKLESRKYPGEYYYVGPDGPTWAHPAATPNERKLAREKLTSIYMQDYLRWGEAALYNPPQLNDGKKASPSYAPHPKAKKDPEHFVSLKQHDFQSHPVSRAQHCRLWPVFKMESFEADSTYRSDFRPQTARRPQSSRHRTPPKHLAFDHNSTSRHDFVNHAPKKPKIVHPVPQLHFRMGTKINSTNRQDFVDHGERAFARARRPRFFRDPGWVRNYTVGTSASDRPEDHPLFEITDPLEAEERMRMVPVVDGSRPGQFASTYQSDFVEATKLVPVSLRRSSRELDRSSVRRVKAYEELRGLE